MNALGPGFVITALLGAAAFTIFYIIKSKHIERMARIENGMSDDESKNSSNIILNLGILFCALAVGVFISYSVSTYTEIPEYITIPGFLLLFGGISFLISHNINKKENI